MALQGEKQNMGMSAAPMQGNGAERNPSNYYTGIDWLGVMVRLLEKIHWIVLAALGCALVAGIYVYLFVTPIYQATAKIYMVGSETAISLSDLQIGTNLLADYKEVFKNVAVHETVRRKLELDYSATTLSDMVSVSNPDGTHVLYINARSADPMEAKLLADTYADVVKEFIAATMDVREPNLFEEAQYPARPVSPNRRNVIIRGFAFGFLAAVVVIVLLYLLDDRISSADDVAKVCTLPVLGVIPRQQTEADADVTLDRREKKRGREK